MKNYIYKDKTEELALANALSDLNIDRKDIVYKVNYKKDGILSKKCEIIVYKIDEILDDIKEKLSNILSAMEIEANIDVKYESDMIFIDVDSKENKIIIGKNGDVLKSLKILMYAYIKQFIDISIKMDIGSYQKNIDEKLRRNVKKLIREVIRTGVPYKLDSMNSYQRKIVHDVVGENDKVTSTSYGEEPNRYIEIKRK